MNDAYFHEVGERGSADVEAAASSAGIRVGTFSEEDAIHAEIGFDAALRLGTWLIAQAIAGGARPSPNPETTP